MEEEVSQPRVGNDLMFAWLSPIETHVDTKIRVHRPKSPSPNSPLVRAKTAIRRTFSAGQKGQEHRQRVKDANEACLWLKAAGFPQYVQMFEEGEFPINLSKFQVERDHVFLDQSAIESLIRRLNVLNRCADVVEEVRTKDDGSEDEMNMRALSEFWHFKRRSRKWSRKSRGRRLVTSDYSDDAHYQSPTSPSPPSVLVSELRNSLTHLDRTIKCFSFMPNEDFPPIIIDPPSETTNTVSYGGFTDYTLPRNTMDSFATGILDTFESNLQKIQQQSISLPDVFSSSQLCEVDLSTSESPISSTSASTASILEDTKDSSVLLLDDPQLLSPSSVHINGHADDHEEILTASGRTVGSVGSSGTIDSSPVGSECDDKFSPQHRASMESSAGEMATYPEVLSPLEMKAANGSLGRFKTSKWHSFQQAHSFRQAFKPVRTLIPIEELSCGQIGVLRKLSLVKLTALLELHKAKTNVARLLKGGKQKVPDCKNKRVFGVPLSVNVRRYGQALPKNILYAMKYLRETGLDTKGLFRRAASKAKVGALKTRNEANPANTNYDGFTSYDVADMIKLYFRELQEPLLSSKLSEILVAIHENIPEQVRFQAMQAVVLLMPDESREALQGLLQFLKEVSEQSDVNQMDAQNLAVCFAPTLFQLSCSHSLKPSPLVRRSGSFKRTSTNHSPKLLTANKEVTDSVASSQCLAEMIRHCHRLFMVAADMIQMCKFSHLESGDPVPYHEIGQNRFGFGNFHSYVDNCVSTVLKESRRKFKGWVHYDTVRGADISYLKIGDGVSLRLWRGTVEIPATPDAVLIKLWTQRHVWDGDVVQPRLLAQIDHRTEVYQYVTRSMPPLTDRDHCVLRSWRHDSTSDSYVVVGTSVSHPSADLLAGIRATELATRYLIEAVDKDTSRLTYICRVDLRGRSVDYYNNSFGPYLASSVNLVKDSFQELEYLETPV